MLEPVKDPIAAHPVASAWRPVLAAVVRAFVRDDFELAAGVPTVASPTKALAAQPRANVAALERVVSPANCIFVCAPGGCGEHVRLRV